MGNTVIGNQLQQLVFLSVGKINQLLLLFDFLRQRTVFGQHIVHP